MPRKDDHSSDDEESSSESDSDCDTDVIESAKEKERDRFIRAMMMLAVRWYGEIVAEKSTILVAGLVARLLLRETQTMSDEEFA